MDETEIMAEVGLDVLALDSILFLDLVLSLFFCSLADPSSC